MNTCACNRAAGLLLIVAVMISAGCTGGSPSTNEGAGAYLEPPVSRWLGSDFASLGETFELLRPAEGQSEGVVSDWMDGFAATLPGGEDGSLTFGLAPEGTVIEAGFQPFIIWQGDEPLALTRACTHMSGCVSCIDAVSSGGTTAPAKPDSAFSGVCGTLSTAYSLVYSLGLRIESGDLGTVDERQETGSNGEQVTKKYWKKGFLQTIREDQEHTPGKGTSRDKIKKAYERYGCTCDDEVSVADAGGVDAWKAQLSDKLDDQPPADCHFIIDGVEPGDSTKKWAHDMHIDGIDDVLGVANTGIQGSGSGDDIPVLGGHQEWTISEGPDGPQISCSANPSGSVDFWNSKPIKMASFICCSCPSTDSETGQ